MADRTSSDQRVSFASEPNSEKAFSRDTSASDRSSSDSSFELEAGILKEAQDPESQQPIAAEHYVSLRAKLLFLAAYFLLNLFLTLSNKSLLGKVRDFHPQVSNNI